MKDLTSAKSVAICDAEPVVIEGIRSVLNESDDLFLAAADTSLLGSLEIAREHKPSIMILDKSFGVHAVMDCIRRLVSNGHNVTPIVWGLNLNEAEALRMLQAGALGVIQKTASIRSLLDCIRSVAAGNTWMEDTVLQEPARPTGGTRSTLTSRELQVVELVEQGLRNRDIAMQLGIRPGTVKIHLKHIFEKTGIRGRYGLALSGLKEKGLISLSAA